MLLEYEQRQKFGFYHAYDIQCDYRHSWEIALTKSVRLSTLTLLLDSTQNLFYPIDFDEIKC